jgi:chaperonin GroEL
MAHKRILFSSVAREKILQGATLLADAVRITLGPKSKSVLIQSKRGEPIVCNDGVTIAKELELLDPVENMGAQMLRQAAVKTGDVVGDGTSTSIVLAHAMLIEGMRNVVAGTSAIDIKRGLDNSLKTVIAALHELSKTVKSRTEKMQVAAISAHNDNVIGELVAEAMDRVGDDGVITVEESKTTETTLDVVEGMQFEHGYISPYFVTDAKKMEAVLEDVYILLGDRKISVIKDLIPLLEKIAKTGKPLLLMAEDIEGDALTTLIVNQISGVLRCVAVKAPGFGERRKDILQDIAILTGGQVITNELGLQLEDVQLTQLGQAKRVVVSRETTVIIGSSENTTAIAARVQQLRTQIESSTSDYDREKLQERLGKLTGGVAVIRVGAPSEAEIRSKKDALDDAIHATKAAVEEGVVPGGGLALLRCLKALDATENAFNDAEKIGLRILRHAMTMPARQIAENSDVDGGVVVERMLNGLDNVGFDASCNHYVDLMEAGIVDPTKVVRSSLENAVSVASVLLLTEATIYEVPEVNTLQTPQRDMNIPM